MSRAFTAFLNEASSVASITATLCFHPPHARGAPISSPALSGERDDADSHSASKRDCPPKSLRKISLSLSLSLSPLFLLLPLARAADNGGRNPDNAVSRVFSPRRDVP